MACEPGDSSSNGAEVLARELLAELEVERGLYRLELAEDDMGASLVACVREFDLLFDRVGHQQDTKEAERLRFMRVALPHAVREIFNAVPRFSLPGLNFPRDPLTAALAQNLLMRVGCVEQARHLAFATIAGKCDLRRQSDGSWEFRVPRTFSDFEEHENDLERLMARNAGRRIQGRISSLVTPDTERRLEAIFRENVYVYRGRYIGYNADPALDSHFFALAYASLLTEPGFDAFHYSATFGGIPYVTWLLALTYFQSVSLKHRRFCAALIAKHPDIRLGDIVTTVGERAELIDSIEAALNAYGPAMEGFRPVGKQEALQIYRTLSLRRDNVGLLAEGQHTIPLVVEYSDTHVLKALAGPQLSPGKFLLDALRFNFPRDYDANQRGREKAMQLALRRVLAQALPSVEFRDNITIRRGRSKLTDIDFVVIEPSSGDVLLVQLKHQDHYGADMKKRLGRSERLLEETSRWTKAVVGWLGESSEDEVRATLRIRRTAAFGKVRLVTIARNFSHVLHPLAADERFAYGTWAKVVEALQKLDRQGSFRTLAGLFGHLRSSMAHRVAQPSLVAGGAFGLKTLRYTVLNEA